MTSLRIIFMGTPAFAVPTLQTLLTSEHKIVAVYTATPKPAGRGQKETQTPVHMLAAEHNIPVHTPKSLKDASEQEIFKQYNADVAIVAAYGLLLPPAILTGTRMGCLNVHPSLLPRWRGAAPLQRTIMAGDAETGIVIMQMNAGLDTGDMLLVERYPVLPGTTAGMLHDEMAGKAGALILKTLEGLTAGTIHPVPQPSEGVTYAQKITKDECRIDWSQPAETLRNKILGLSPHPTANFIYKGETIKILDADVYPPGKMFATFAPGHVVDNHLTIVCGEGALAPTLVQRPGKKAMQAREMLAGYPIPDGTKLE